MAPSKWHRVYPIKLCVVLLMFSLQACVKEQIVNNSSDPNAYVGNISTIQDIDGNTYRARRIGALTWMIDNLRATRYRNGTAILRVDGNTQWGQLTTPAYSVYGGDEANIPRFGLLYNHGVVSTGLLCPTGWRVASNEEWTELISLYGGHVTALPAFMEQGFDSWNSSNTNATNTSGFGAVGGGMRTAGGSYESLLAVGRYWSSSVVSSGNLDVAHQREFRVDLDFILQNHTARRSGLCVRCVKD